MARCERVFAADVDYRTCTNAYSLFKECYKDTLARLMA